ncbi:MAG: response regulator transcription factor [Roseiflexaceae bacterium]
MMTEHANVAKPIRTLLVDDSPSFLDALTRLLARAPQVVVSATAIDGMEALMAIACSAPDLVVIDVAMPGVSGIEVTRQIKRVPDAPRIIVITISTDAAYAVAARQAGADGFLTKTACRTQLIPLIQSLFTAPT